MLPIKVLFFLILLVGWRNASATSNCKPSKEEVVQRLEDIFGAHNCYQLGDNFECRFRSKESGFDWIATARLTNTQTKYRLTVQGETCDPTGCRTQMGDYQVFDFNNGKCLNDLNTDLIDRISSRVPPLDCKPELGGQDGHLFHLQLILDNSIDWSLTNELVNTTGWKGGPVVGNRDRYFQYAVCLPVNECWDLVLDDELSSDSATGSFKAYLGGELILSDDNFENFAEHKICVGRTKHCHDITEDFQYRHNKVNGKVKTRDMTCDALGDLGEQRKRRICDDKFGIKGEGSAKVKTKCLETCGLAGRGDCQFLKNYANRTELVDANKMTFLSFLYSS